LLAAACGFAPSTVSVNTGNALSGSASSLASNNDDFYTVGASCSGFFGGCVAEWQATIEPNGFGPDLTNATVAMQYTGKNAGAGYQIISAFNWRTWSWVDIDGRVVATSEETVTVNLPGTGWLLPVPQKGFNGVVQVRTIGNFTSTSADLLVGCMPGTCP